jgi:hypothetical protein
LINAVGFGGNAVSVLPPAQFFSARHKSSCFQLYGVSNQHFSFFEDYFFDAVLIPQRYFIKSV